MPKHPRVDGLALHVPKPGRFRAPARFSTDPAGNARVLALLTALFRFLSHGEQKANIVQFDGRLGLRVRFGQEFWLSVLTESWLSAYTALGTKT
jgi:hypothetical protein